VPANAVVAIGSLSWLLMAPSLVSTTVDLVANSIAVIGLSIAFALPIILGRDTRQTHPGPKSNTRF
jgi:hypothetical protein